MEEWCVMAATVRLAVYSDSSRFIHRLRLQEIHCEQRAFEVSELNVDEKPASLNVSSRELDGPSQLHR